MDKRTQKELVDSIIDGIRGEIHGAIDAGKIPETWDGVELRWLLKDKFANVAWKSMGTIRRRRFFNNHCLTEGIR